MSKVIAVVFAGGVGSRMGGSLPKQFMEMLGKPVLAWTLEVFERHPRVDSIVLVANGSHLDDTRALCKKYAITKVEAVVEGGASAQESIYNGLCAVSNMGAGPDEVVLLNDGVRPYIDVSVIDAVIDSVRMYGNGVTFTPCYETIVLSGDGAEISAIPARKESYTAQAPQGFRLGELLNAHRRIRSSPEGYEGLVDQATLYWKLGLPIHLVRGNRGNIKITTPEDICMLEALIKHRESNCE
jgi:2-C-methyl-D-erythritol 4-phosphate cytidylyltransferase